ncbi:MAG: hypothetical protein U0746_04845 [Gemmataceae bacterium]
MNWTKSFGIVALCLVGCASPPPPKTEIVSELVAAREIPAGTTIDRSNDLFHYGRLYYKGEKPKQSPLLSPLPLGVFPGAWMGMMEGKKVARSLKKGETVRMSDIVESDDSPFQVP